MNNQFYQELIENLHDGVYYVDRHKKITYWNKAAERITGYSKEEVMGLRCLDNILIHIDESGKELCITGCPLGKSMIDGNISEMNIYLHHKNGYRVPVEVRVSPIKDEAGKVIGAVELFSDSSKRMETIKELEYLRKEIFLDELTQVANRKFAEIEFPNKMNDLHLYNIKFGILFVDIDYFKKVNDIYGHHVGDQILAMVAKTMVNAVRNMDIVVRWGGEEFLVIVPNIDITSLKKIAERLRVFIEKSWLTLENGNLNVTASIGGAIAHREDTIDSLIARADLKMYESKKSGRNRVSIDDC